MAIKFTNTSDKLPVNGHRIKKITINVSSNIKPYLDIQWEDGNYDMDNNWTYIRDGANVTVKDIEEIKKTVREEGKQNVYKDIIIVQEDKVFSDLAFKKVKIDINGEEKEISVYSLISKLCSEVSIKSGVFSGEVI